MDHTRLKVCCIANRSEAQLAIELGAEAIGLVGAMPSGPGIITDEVARDIAAYIPAHISSFLLTSEIRADEIAAHVNGVGANTVQIVNHIDPEESKALADLMPDTCRVQVIHVESAQALELIEVYEPFCDAFLLDSGKPSLPTPELGGTGRTHDWKVSRDFVARSTIPVYLAGGLRPENVEEAVRTVRPYGIDVCSGLRSDGQLDAGKLQSFAQNIKKADGQ